MKVGCEFPVTLCTFQRSRKGGPVGANFDDVVTSTTYVLDLQEYCAFKGIKIKDSFYIDSEKDKLIKENPNLNADTAIFVLSKN